MAHPDRDSLFAAKIAQIKQNVDTWAKENDILNPTEEIRIDLRIHGRILTTSKVVILTPDDWSEIMAFKWNRSQRALFEKLRVRDNEPTLYEELFLPGRVGMIDSDSLNQKLCAVGCRFRLKAHETSPYKYGKGSLVHLRLAKSETE